MLTAPANLASVRIAVVVPCFRVGAQVIDVLTAIGPEVCRIYVVDDCCPEGSADIVSRELSDRRIHILRNPLNLGVGGAVMQGYRQAIAERMDIVVKIDGDGQMDPRLVSRIVAPIVTGRADYAKGNRFYDLAHISRMPTPRIVGNAILSFMSKFSTGYWGVFDPTNGFTAIAVPVAAMLPFDKISQRFFFETDLLFRLNTVRAVVVDMPMHSHYGNESSNLRILSIVPEFLVKHARNLWKRIFYSYFLRDMSIASLELVAGLLLLMGGLFFGCWHWARGFMTGVPSQVGTIMLAALPILIGVQLVLAFLAYDFTNVPKRPLITDLQWPPEDSNN